MKATEGKLGRVFVVRLEDGDMLPACIERLAEKKGITCGHVVLIGGIGGGEVVGNGLIVPDEDGRPALHMHAALGRSGQTLTGCIRYGVSTWVVAEAIIYEITGVKAARLPDKETGFTLLEM